MTMTIDKPQNTFAPKSSKQAVLLPPMKDAITLEFVAGNQPSAGMISTFMTPMNILHTARVYKLAADGSGGSQRSQSQAWADQITKGVLEDIKQSRFFMPDSLVINFSEGTIKNNTFTIQPGVSGSLVDGGHRMMVFENLYKEYVTTNDEELKSKLKEVLYETPIPVTILNDIDLHLERISFLRFNADIKKVAGSHNELLRGEASEFKKPVDQLAYEVVRQLAEVEGPFQYKVNMTSTPSKEYPISLANMRKGIADNFLPTDVGNTVHEVLSVFTPLREAFPDDVKFYSTAFFNAVLKIRDELSYPGAAQKLATACPDGISTLVPKGAGSGAAADIAMKIKNILES